MDSAYGAARELAARGVTTGSRVAIDATAAQDVLAWFVGADLLGAATLVAEPSWTPRERDAVFEDARPDVVLVGTHGRSGWQRLRIGSIAEAVIRRSPVSVLVVPPTAAFASSLVEAATLGSRFAE